MAEKSSVNPAPVSKWAPAVALAWLIPGGGHFLLEDPISKYLPEFKNPRVLVKPESGSPYTIPAVRESDREYQATLPTIIISSNLGPEEWYMARLNSKYIASAADRWTGRNKLGYSNPQADQLFDRLQTTIDPGQRNALHRELVQLETSEVAYMPLYWEVLPLLALKGVKLPQYSNRSGTHGPVLRSRQS